MIGLFANAATSLFLRREIENNDTAHAEPRADVEKLLTGAVPRVASLNSGIDRLRDLMPGRQTEEP